MYNKNNENQKYHENQEFFEIIYCIFNYQEYYKNKKQKN